MKITHLSTYPVGGAAIAARRLHEGMVSLGLDSTFYTLFPEKGQIHNHSVYQHQPNLVQNLKARLKWGRMKRISAIKTNLPKWIDWFSFVDNILFPENHPAIQEADILIVHWCSDWLNWSSFFDSVKEKGIILVMHDMNHITGGCHYSLGCQQFNTYCMDCPQVEGLKADDLVHRNFDVKRKAYDRDRLIVTMPSFWMADNAWKSRVLGGKPIQKVNYGLNTAVFSRHAGPPNAVPVIGFVADSLANSRKGFNILLEVLRVLGKEGNTSFKVRVMGAHAIELSDFDHPIEFLGKVSGDSNLAAFYNSIDLFVIPSSYDNQPNTVIEALCCGVPVIGFPGSGVAEMVSEGVNGLVAPALSPIALKETIKQALEMLDQFDSDSISQNAKETYDYRRMAEEYRLLSETLLR